MINFSSKQWAFLCSVQKNILCSYKEVAKSVQNNINQWNFTGIEESRPDAQLKTLSSSFLWMRHWKCKSITEAATGGGVL